MKDPQHRRQCICYGISASGLHNYLCIFSLSEFVSLELVAVNFCLCGSIISGLLVSIFL